MIDWKRGGWTGSLNARVRREIREHFHENALARRSRYPRLVRLLHGIFDDGTFGRLIAFYIVLALLVGSAELVLTTYWPDLLPRWTGATGVKSLLTTVAGFLIAAQVGVLGVISIAVGLITIIGQRENATTDIQVYYHESLAFGVVASSIALLAALCAQLLWPVQFALHWFGYGTGLHFFKLILTMLHIIWLLLNLFGMAHFIATTLSFVQQTARETLRERYTTNVVLPVEMSRRLREQLYLGAGPQFVEKFWPAEKDAGHKPMVYLGADFGRAGEVEISLDPSSSLVLRDVRVAWIQWVVCRWLGRCRNANDNHENGGIGGLMQEPLLVFPPRLDVKAEARAGLCRRRGGAPLSWLEKLVLYWAFKFGRMRDEA